MYSVSAISPSPLFNCALTVSLGIQKTNKTKFVDCWNQGWRRLPLAVREGCFRTFDLRQLFFLIAKLSLLCVWVCWSFFFENVSVNEWEQMSTEMNLKRKNFLLFGDFLYWCLILRSALLSFSGFSSEFSLWQSSHFAECFFFFFVSVLAFSILCP